MIASIIPETGPAGEFGAYNREASELFVDDYNHSHPNGPQLRHVFQDSESTPKAGVTAARAILAQESPIAIQVQLSAVSVAVAPIIADTAIPMLTIAGSARPKELYSLAFRNYPDPVHTAQETVRVFLADNPSSTVGILWMNDEFGRSVKSAFEQQLAADGITLAASAAFDKSATDFRPAVTKVVGAAPATVYTVGFGNPLGRILIQLRELGFEGQILGGPEMAFTDVLGIAGAAAEGAKYLDLAFDLASDNSLTNTFVSRYRTRFDRDPSAVSAVVYDGWSLMLHAIDMCDSPAGPQVAETLLTIKDFPGINGQLSVSPQRDIVYTLRARIISDGKPTLLE